MTPHLTRRPVIGIPADYTAVTNNESWHPRWQLNQTYVDAVVDAGGLPLILPMAPEPPDQLIGMLDGLILSGGGDMDPARYGHEVRPECGPVTPERDDLELRMFAAARGAGLPVLGICRGHQVINVALGGTLVQDIPSQAPSEQQHNQHLAGFARDDVSHRVRLEPGSRLAEIYGTSEVQTNTYHHQAIDSLGAGLVVTGRADDGTIESVETTEGSFLVAVQWHPETLYRRHTEHASIFRAFIAAAEAFATQETEVTAVI
ncbi:MAG TPA: gamma-glutamyl-gamma-aminobutyrate hydrolase family protein [Thermomicrobiales bacterium]|jgi:putative glutamine amidotransferase|nr:gamma-glutamyl-gamma-aminobutyrate hydrolase family protein [Thermomicrobiales bacterium]